MTENVGRNTLWCGPPPGAPMLNFLRMIGVEVMLVEGGGNFDYRWVLPAFRNYQKASYTISLCGPWSLNNLALELAGTGTLYGQPLHDLNSSQQRTVLAMLNELEHRYPQLYAEAVRGAPCLG